MVAACITAFLDTDGQGQFAPHQVTTIGVDLLERATELTAVAPRRTHALTTPESEGLVGIKRWGSRPRTRGTPQALEDHPGHRVARGALCLVMAKPSRVEHLEASDALDHSSDSPSMVHAFNTDGCPR